MPDLQITIDGAQGDHPTQEEVEDYVADLVTAGTNVSVTYDDGAGTLTIDTSALNKEEVEDAVSSLLTAGSGVSVAYDDGADALTVSVDEAGLSFFDGTELTADVNNQSTHTDEVFLGEVSSTPTDSEIGTGNVAFYAKSDGNLYKRPHGGSESQVGGGGIFTDGDSDGIYEQTTGDGIEVSRAEVTQTNDDASDGIILTGSNGNTFKVYYDGTALAFTDAEGDKVFTIRTDGRAYFNTNKSVVFNASPIFNDGLRIGQEILRLTGQDVRNVSSPSQGWVAYHDGSGSNTEGLAAYNGTNWVSQVDGSTIS